MVVGECDRNGTLLLGGSKLLKSFGIYCTTSCLSEEITSERIVLDTCWECLRGGTWRRQMLR